MQQQFVHVADGFGPLRWQMAQDAVNVMKQRFFHYRERRQLFVLIVVDAPCNDIFGYGSVTGIQGSVPTVQNTKWPE